MALYCNGANAIFTPWPRMVGVPVALNVDGIERKRKKWNRLARGLVSGFGMAGHVLPHGGDHRRAAIQDYYRERYGKESVFIPYGAEAERSDIAECWTGWAWSRAATSST